MTLSTGQFLDTTAVREAVCDMLPDFSGAPRSERERCQRYDRPTYWLVKPRSRPA